MENQQKEIPRTSGPGWGETYIFGYAICLILTVVAYLIAAGHVTEGSFFYVSLAALAVLQIVIQIVFFLHLGEEPKPKWNSIAFLFMLLVLFILVGGTLWIMSHLDYQMMPHMSGEYTQ